MFGSGQINYTLKKNLFSIAAQRRDGDFGWVESEEQAEFCPTVDDNPLDNGLRAEIVASSSQDINSHEEELAMNTMDAESHPHQAAIEELVSNYFSDNEATAPPVMLRGIEDDDSRMFDDLELTAQSVPPESQSSLVEAFQDLQSNSLRQNEPLLTESKIKILT